MLQTFFHIPHQIGGLPVFGLGIAIVLWALFAVGYLAWSAVARGGLTDEVKANLPILAIVGLAIVFVLPGIEEKKVNGDPIGLAIRGYGVMLVLGVAAGVALALRRAKQVGIDSETILSLAFWVFIGGIAGARAFYVIEYRDRFIKPSVIDTVVEILKFTEGGLVVYGSFFGAAAATWLYTRRHKVPLLPISDVVAPTLMIGVAIGRIGCLLNGCCHGGVSHVPGLTITFPAPSPPYLSQLHSGELLGLKLVPDPDREGEFQVESVQAGSLAAQRGIRANDRLTNLKTSTPALYQGLQLDPHSPAPVIAFVSPGGPQVWTFAQLPPRSQPVQPAQIYSTIDAAIICVFLCFYTPYRRWDGEVFAWLITVYPISRFLVEIIRTDEPGQFNTPFSISQLVSLALLAAAGVFWVWLSRQPVKYRHRIGPSAN